MPSRTKVEKITTKAGSDQRQAQIQLNQTITDNQTDALGLSTSRVLAWSSVTANNTSPTVGLGTLGRGSTDTAIASGAFRFIITGQAASEAKAAVTTGTAIGAQTVPASKWACYALDVATGGTITVTAAAANATTGYASEALAIAACPARVTGKARMGYITVLATASTWVAATDALAGGSSGNPATTTNYYPVIGIDGPTGTPANCGLITGSVYPGGLWNGGANGVLIPTVLSRGSTDTNLQTTAFTFNASGACDIAKGAVAAGTAFGALGTIPTSKWGLIAMFIDGGGTFSFKSAPGNYTGDYTTEKQAQGGLPAILPPTNKCFVGYVTIQSSTNAAGWVCGTDALAGGASGNPAAATNYYPTVGIDLPTSGPDFSGQTAAQIAATNGVVLGPANY